MKLKASVVALGLTAALAQPAFATEQELTSSDLAFAFQPQQTAQPTHIAALSQQEMKETEGEFVWFTPLLYTALRFSPYIPTVGVWALHQAPRMGNFINNIRNP